MYTVTDSDHNDMYDIVTTRHVVTDSDHNDMYTVTDSDHHMYTDIVHCYTE